MLPRQSSMPGGDSWAIYLAQKYPSVGSEVCPAIVKRPQAPRNWTAVTMSPAECLARCLLGNVFLRLINRRIAWLSHSQWVCGSKTKPPIVHFVQTHLWVIWNNGSNKYSFSNNQIQQISPWGLWFLLPHSQSVGPEKSAPGAVYKLVEKVLSDTDPFLYITLLSLDHIWKDTGEA